MLKEDKKMIQRVAKYSASAKARRKDRVIILDGVHVVREMLLCYSSDYVQSLYVTKEALLSQEVTSIVSRISSQKVIRVSLHTMKKMAPTVTPQGILAVCTALPAPVYAAEEFVLILEDVQDPLNVGAMIRSGVSLGVQMVGLTKKCADVWSPRALRASQGAHFYTKIITEIEMEDFAAKFAGKVIGTVVDEKSQSLYDADLTGSVAITMGNEGAGITQSTQDLCDESIFIPLRGKFESLNVANACAIVCAEKFRQDISH